MRCTAAGIATAAELLAQARIAGNIRRLGRGGCQRPKSRAIAEKLGAPVATTLQGLSAFPANHPLHAGFCLGRAAVPAVEKAFENCDCLLAVGTRFGEIATGSYGWNPPANLIHVDVNPAVFGANYPAKVALEGDAKLVLQKLLAALGGMRSDVERPRRAAVAATDRRRQAAYREEWFAHDSQGRVNPARFFASLRRQLADDATVVLDDGNHTFLAAELLPIHQPRGLMSPTDFNCMGYCVPAAIGAKLARPRRRRSSASSATARSA